MSDLVINESNFSEYFRDCRNSKPERGDVMARYVARAEFVDGHMKKDIIDLLQKDKAIAATNVMRKLGHATQNDAVRVCKEICQDLVCFSVEEVEKKIYKYTVEFFYYTKKEYVPIDPHWSLIGISNLDEFLDKANQKIKITSKIIDNC